MNQQDFDWDALRKNLIRHPFLVLATFCLFVTAIFDVTAVQLINGEMLAAIFAVLMLFSLISYYSTRNHPLWKNYTISLWLLGLLCIISIGIVFLETSHKTSSLMVIGFVFLTLLFFFWLIQKEMTARRLVFLIIAAGLMLRVGYILYTGVEVRQHDVYSFGQAEGHAGYIEYLYNNMRLPDFDPRNVWQYYHPPLHHILAAIWLKLNTLLGVTWERAKENIQILSLFYSGCSMILSYKIFRELGLKKIGLIGALVIIAFHPTFIIMSGSVNNDILSITFMLGAVLTTIRWYKNPTMKNILKIALFVGFSMMTKLSGGLVAPAIAMVFVIRLFSRKEKLSSLMAQFSAFGVLCFPLALWWGIRNLILFKVPIAYVPRLGLDLDQYVGNHSPLARLFDFSLFQFKSVYVSWGKPYHEYNVFIGLLKTSVFEELRPAQTSPAIGAPAVFLFYFNFALVLISLVAMVVCLFRKKSPLGNTMKGFILVLYLTVIGSYVKFCFDFPHTCTQNIRYATPAILVGALFIGLFIEMLMQSKKKRVKQMSFVILGVIVLFAISSVTFHTLLGW